MTVFKVAVVASPGGTSSESSIARHRPGRGDLRRSEFGGQRRVDGGGHAGLAARPRGADQFDAATGGAGWWRAAGRKVLTLVATILGGGSHIDHASVLRAGATQRVLPFRVMAPSTLGTFLRSFTFGHVRQLDAVIAETI